MKLGGCGGINVIASDGTVTNLVHQGSRVFGEGLTKLDGKLASGQRLTSQFRAWSEWRASRSMEGVRLGSNGL